MFCPECRTELSEDTKYCIKCGYDFTKIKTPPERKHTSDSPDTLDGSSTIYQPEIEADSFKVGSLFADRYEILSEGRKGGMGTVYKCKDTKLEEIVALKVIHPKLLSSTQAVSRFRQEVALSRKLQHPNIVRVYNLEEWQDKEYFTMEWVEGVTLREILNKRKKQNKPFTLIEAGNIISQLTTTLHYAHKYTVHRDIKPENILVETDEDKDKVQKDLTNIKIRLTDFGIAKMLSPGVFTTASIQMGTPYYMAPEQKTDAATVDKRADIYALGVVLFELLTLENTIGLELPSEINRELPKEINNVTKKAVATKPDMRYGDINDLLADLDKIIVEDKRRIEEERKNEKELKGQEGESISAQSQEAIESCKDPDDAEAHYNLAHAYLKSGKLKKAIKPLKQAVRIGPFALAHYNLGSAYRNSDKLKKAIESFKQAIGIKPDHALAHYYLGVVYLNSGKLKKAIESYKQAIRINPDDALFHINLGVAYGRSGMYKKAIESLKQAIRIEPDSAWAHKDLGCAYHELGMQKEAIESYKQAIRLDPDYAWVQKDIEAIEMEGDAGNQAWRDFLK